MLALSMWTIQYVFLNVLYVLCTTQTHVVQVLQYSQTHGVQVLQYSQTHYSLLWADVLMYWSHIDWCSCCSSLTQWFCQQADCFILNTHTHTRTHWWCSSTSLCRCIWLLSRSVVCLIRGLHPCWTSARCTARSTACLPRSHHTGFVALSGRACRI